MGNLSKMFVTEAVSAGKNNTPNKITPGFNTADMFDMSPMLKSILGCQVYGAFLSDPGKPGVRMSVQDVVQT